MSRLLLPDLQCPDPACRRRPPFRITADEQLLAAAQPPDMQKGTWQCRCGKIIPITARAYQRAA